MNSDVATAAYAQQQAIKQTMTEWFVYCDAEFYPWAEIVEAPTAAEAAANFTTSTGEHLAVFPLDALALSTGDVIEAARREGRYPDV